MTTHKRYEFLTLIPAALMLLYPVPRSALADHARFGTDGATVTAEINGTPWPLPAGFGLSRSSVPVVLDGSVSFCVHSFLGYNGHHPTWIGGSAPAPFGWSAVVGTFGGISYPNCGGCVELYPMPLVVAGYPMERLLGEPVWVIDGATPDAFTVVIGSSPFLRTPRGDVNYDGERTVEDIFTFLGAWFSDAPAADFNGSGSVTVQDIFDFLEAYCA